MPRNPQKLSLKLDPDSVARYKRFDCVHYSKCLNEASIENWPQFHCNDCTEYESDLEVFSFDLTAMGDALRDEDERG